MSIVGEWWEEQFEELKALHEAECASITKALIAALRRVDELEGALFSTRIEVDHHKRTVHALTSRGNYDAGKMEEGLDGQWIKELGLRWPPKKI